MTFLEPSTEEKHAFFTELDGLGTLSDSDDGYGTRAARDEERRRWRNALQKSSKSHTVTPSAIPHPRHSQERLTTRTQRPESSPNRAAETGTHAPLQPIHPRRIFSDPPRKTRSPVLPEATHADPSRAPLQSITLERSASSPNPVTKQLLPQKSKVCLPSMAPQKGRRKGRLAGPQVRNTMFTGMAFYFLPDDDKNPLRKKRIQKVIEGSGRWTRSLHDATHIISDDIKLKWKDIERFVMPRGDLNGVLILNGMFISDCIDHGVLVNHEQEAYQVKGYPGNKTSASALPTSTTSIASRQSLELKPPQRNPNRWDHAPIPSTPPRSEDSSQRNSVSIRVESCDQHGVAQTSRSASPTVPEHPKNRTEPGACGLSLEAKFNDDLSQIIIDMQQVRDLPLDDADDDAKDVDNPENMIMDSDSEAGSEGERDRKRQKREKQGQKNIAWEDRFACHKGGTLDGKKEDSPNARVIEMLQRMCDHYERTNETWRNISYRKAIATLKKLPYKVTTAQQAKCIANIGDSIARKIEEIVTTDRLKRLEYAEQEPADIILKKFLQIYGVGTAQANQWIAKGYRTLDDLMQKAKLTANQKIGIERYEDLNTRIPRREVEALGAHVKAAAGRIDADIELVIGGSYRRGARDSGDIDFIVSKKGTTSSEQLLAFLFTLTRSLEAEGFLVAKLAASSKRDGSKWHGCCVLPKPEGVKDEEYKPIWRRIDFLVVPKSEMGAALIYFTGNDIFNRSIRLLAGNKGMSLNQRGLYKDVVRGLGRVKVTEGELVESKDEKKIFEILGVQWREPHERWC